MPAARRFGLRWARAGLLSGSRTRREPRPSGRRAAVADSEECRVGCPPDPDLVERLDRHGQGHLLRWWDELDETAGPRLVAEIAAIDFDQLDDLIAELVHGEAAAGRRPSTRSSRSRSIRLPQTDGERVARRHVAERRRATPWRPARSASSWSPAGSGTRLGFDGPEGDVSRSARSRPPACSRSTPRRSSPWAAGTAGRPALHHDQPREPRGDRAVLRRARRLRPGPRPVLRPGADAGRRPRDRARSCWPRKDQRRPQPRRPRRDARRPGRARARTARRAASTRCASGASARSSTSRSTTRWSRSPTRRSSACTARPTPRCRSRSIEKARARREARRGGRASTAVPR